METTTTKTENKMVKMFNELKAKHSDAVILFRVGDFYETYFEDAQPIADVISAIITVFMALHLHRKLTETEAHISMEK